jgi:catechol 2,3-dioxygenase-like lactoylglutathione lyase family enzyme
MTIFSIDTVAVVVSDRRSALAWYRDVLGLPAAYIGPPEAYSDPTIQGSPEKPGHWIEVGPGRPFTRIHLCELPSGKLESGPTGITLLTEDIQFEYNRLKQKGVRFLSPPMKMEWGEWICEFADPDGNEFDLKQPIPLTK